MNGIARTSQKVPAAISKNGKFGEPEISKTRVHRGHVPTTWFSCLNEPHRTFHKITSRSKVTSKAKLCDSSCAEVCVARTNAEKFQGFDRARNPGSGDSKRRRRREDFRRVRGPIERILSFNRANVRGYAGGGGSAPRPAFCNVSREIRRSHSANSTGRRKRISQKTPPVAGSAAGRKRCKKACAVNGIGSSAFLSKGGRPSDARANPRIVEQAGG